jgi:hypothetical protein
MDFVANLSLALFGTCIEFDTLPELLEEPLFFLTRRATL